MIEISNGMKVLVIGGDPNLFFMDSGVLYRAKEYASLFDAYHIINMTTGDNRTQAHGNLVIHPTNSKFSILRFWDAFRLARRVAGEIRADVIDAQDPFEAGLAAWLVSKKTGIPLRIQIHVDVFSSYYRRAGWKERMRYWLARFLIPRADCIRVVSERIKQSIIFNFQFSIFNQFSSSQKVTVLPIYTDIGRFLAARPDAEIEARFRGYDFKMISVGRFVDKEKNFSMLIEMMRDFVKICPKALLVLAGDGPDRTFYQLLTTHYSLEKNVIIEPWRSDLASLYKSFDLYLMPSNYEGWGRTVVEAMASGLPVVMTDVGLAGEVVKDGENGIVVDVGDRAAILEAVTRLFKRPEERGRLTEAGFETVQEFGPRTKEEYLRRYMANLEICCQKLENREENRK